MSLAGVGTCEVQCILGDVTWGLPYTMNIQMSVETLPPPPPGTSFAGRNKRFSKYGMFTLPDTEADIETDKKWLV